jgi:aminopeptidase-like protein
MNYNKIFDELFPICRSITGNGFRESLKILSKFVNFKIYKFKSGSKVYDWELPMEWSINDAYILNGNGKKLIDFNKNNLHVVNYSYPVEGKYSKKSLLKKVHSIKRFPNLIPYVTTYYKKNWGFCIEHKNLKKFKTNSYFVKIDSTLSLGHIEYGLKILRGKTDKIILISSYLCHPSMANNELSGPLVLLGLYEKIKRLKNRKYTYYFLINPETIGSICFINKNETILKKNLVGGLVLTCLGGPKKNITYKKSRDGNTRFDKIFTYLSKFDKGYEIREFDPTEGSDERQYCSAKLNFPVGQVARTVYGQYNEYHTSGDNKKFMNISNIEKSINKIIKVIKINEYINPIERINPKCEIQLGKRNLYPNLASFKTRKQSSDDRIDNRNQLRIIQNILSYADGQHFLIDIATKLNINLSLIKKVNHILKKNKLVKN